MNARLKANILRERMAGLNRDTITRSSERVTPFVSFDSRTHDGVRRWLTPADLKTSASAPTPDCPSTGVGADIYLNKETK